ncbi:MAG TPA: hypothetical protein VK050_04480 [Flavobacteriaceae bacterium]|nr:hypothetical protein [Flavobacteriaceae bacterium]
MRISFALGFLLLLFACNKSTNESISEMSSSEAAALKSKLIKLETQKDSLQVLLEEYHLANQLSWFGDMESRSFKDIGIEEPKKYLIDALRNNPSVIPIDGVLGGTMFFTDIEVLGTKWIIASYEDGHIMGRSIFTYQVNPKTLEVEFAVLDQVSDF